MMLSRRSLAALAACALAAPLTAWGTPYAWNVASGNYSNAANWTPAGGPPGAGDTAVFGSNATVIFSNSPTTGVLDMVSGNVSFSASVAPRTLTLTGSATLRGGNLTLAGAFPSFQLNAGAMVVIDGSTLTVNAGNDVVATSLAIGNSPPATTSLVVIDGVSSTLTVSGGTSLGQNGSVGNLTLQNNASASFASIQTVFSATATSGANILVQSGADVTSSGTLTFGTGTTAGQSSSVTVTGSGSTFVQSGATTLTLGGAANSVTTLGVNSGGVFTTGTGLITVNKTGTLSINGGTFNANGNIVVNAGRLERMSGGTLNLAAGSNLTAQNNGVVSIVGSHTIGGGGTFTIETGADMSVATGLHVGTGSTGALVVDGAESSITAFGASSWGTNGGNATVTVRNGATATVFAALGVNAGNAAGTTASVVVQTGGTLAVQDLLLGNGGGVGSAGSITIHSGSSMTQAATMTIGHSTSGTGTLTINGGGAFSSLSGSMTINATGTLNINTGTFNGNGDITVNGGTLLRNFGFFNLAAGKNLVAQSNGQVQFTGNYFLGTGSTFTIQGGADLSTTMDLNVGVGSAGTLIIDGVGSSLGSGGGGLGWGANGGTGTVTLRNGATATIPGSVEIAAGGAAGTTGTLNVQSGATMAIGNMTIASGGGAGTNGTVTIQDAGSAITQSASGTLTIGHASSGAGSLIINPGAIFSTGILLTTVNATGVLTVNGTFRSPGRVLVNTGAGFTIAGSVDNWTGNFDLRTGSLAWNGTALTKALRLATLQNQVRYGATHSAGITCSLQLPETALAVLDNGVLGLGTFHGMPVDSNSILVTTALLGDANADGVVSFVDFVSLANNFGLADKGWVGGDFNGDATTNFTDYVTLANHFGQTFGGSNLVVSAEDFALFAQASAGFGTAAVPEPGSLALLGISSVALLGRRPRKST